MIANPPVSAQPFIPVCPDGNPSVRARSIVSNTTGGPSGVVDVRGERGGVRPSRSILSSGRWNRSRFHPLTCSAFTRDAKVVFVDTRVTKRSMANAALRHGALAIVFLAAGGTCKLLVFDRNGFHLTTSPAPDPFASTSHPGTFASRHWQPQPIRRFEAPVRSRLFYRIVSPISMHSWKVIAIRCGSRPNGSARSPMSGSAPRVHRVLHARWVHRAGGDKALLLYV